MAENRVEIIVTSRNDTRAGFESAKRDAENAGDAAAQGFAQRFSQRLAGSLLGGGGPGGGAGLLQSVFGAPSAIAAYGAMLAPLIGAVVVEVAGLASGFAAATAGLGAFALFAVPVFKQLQGDAQQLTTLWNGLQTAQDKLAVAQQNFKADPTKANQAALTSAQRGVLTAQNNLSAAQMGMGQDAGPAAAAVLNLRTVYDKLSTALQPQIFKILGDALKVVADVLPALAPMAKAFADALDPLLQKVDAFTKSKGFHQWLTEFDKIIGPATTAIGNGVGKILIALGKLFTVMSSHDVVHTINILFDALAWFFTSLSDWIRRGMNNWDRMVGGFKEAWANVKRWTDDAVAFFEKLPGRILDAIKDLPGQLLDLGKRMIEGLINGLEQVPVLGSVVKIGTGIISKLGSLFGIHSPSTVMREMGRNVTEGFRLGLQDNAANLHLGGSVSGGGAAGGNVVLQVTGAGSGLDALFISWLQKAVRTRGGGGPKSVQIALGQSH